MSTKKLVCELQFDRTFVFTIPLRVFLWENGEVTAWFVREEEDKRPAGTLGTIGGNPGWYWEWDLYPTIDLVIRAAMQEHNIKDLGLCPDE